MVLLLEEKGSRPRRDEGGGWEVKWALVVVLLEEKGSRPRRDEGGGWEVEWALVVVLRATGPYAPFLQKFDGHAD